MSFAGTTAIVTGAASGIGREIARQLSAGGAHVLCTDVDGTAVRKVAAELGNADLHNATAMTVDVTRREDLTNAVDHVVTEHGRLDHMFNNAGVAIFGDVEAVTLDDWDTIIDVNLRGVAYGTTIAYDRMVRQGHGHIVNTASVAGLVPVPLQAHYCATKHAVLGLCKTLRLEARRHGVHVTAFCPGFVETGMFTNHTFRGTLEGADARKLAGITPMPVDAAVRALLRGVARRKPVVVTPYYGKLAWWLERYSPWLSHRFHHSRLVATRRHLRTS